MAKKRESKKHEAKESKKHEAKEARKEKAMKHPDKLGAGAAKRKKLPAKDKKEVVMKEFQRGTLNSGSGQKVINPKQAVAIAYSESGESKKKKRKKKK